MRTINRYFIHFSLIGVVFFIVAILLLAVDGGELLVPYFIIAITFVDICFIILMTVIFNSMAKPQKVYIKPNENIIKEIEKISRKKWGRKTIVQEGNTIKFMFGNKYKDWLVTSIELVEDNDRYCLYLPSSYVEDISYMCDN